MEYAIVEKRHTSAWLISDLKEAVILLKACMESARLNVEINLKAMPNSQFVRATQNQLKLFQKKSEAILKKI